MKTPSLFGITYQWLAIYESLSLIGSSYSLYNQPMGNGERVILLPGFGVDSNTMLPLEKYLKFLGYNSSGWKLGANKGNVGTYTSKMIENLEKEKEPVHLVGWSLGGTIAREVARERPELVKQVISIGSPLIGGPKYTVTAHFYKAKGHDIDSIENNINQRIKQKLRCPRTSIYSKIDGVVHWQASIDPEDPETDYIEVFQTHFGLGLSASVYKIIARKLYENK